MKSQARIVASGLGASISVLAPPEKGREVVGFDVGRKVSSLSFHAQVYRATCSSSRLSSSTSLTLGNQD